MTRTIRPFRPGDLPALYDICLRTGDAGEDASRSYPAGHRELPGAVYAAPYAVLEPDLAFVVDDGQGQAVGYVVGTAGTADFAKRFRAEWLPTVADRFPPPVGRPASPREAMALALHRPERMVRPELAGHPAHLHINLLPDVRRAGHGRALVEILLGALHGRGVPAVHLEMSIANVRARAFYDRLGFGEIAVPDPGPSTFLGRATG